MLKTCFELSVCLCLVSLRSVDEKAWRMASHFCVKNAQCTSRMHKMERVMQLKFAQCNCSLQFLWFLLCVCETNLESSRIKRCVVRIKEHLREAEAWDLEEEDFIKQAFLLYWHIDQTSNILFGVLNILTQSCHCSWLHCLHRPHINLSGSWLSCNHSMILLYTEKTKNIFYVMKCA